MKYLQKFATAADYTAYVATDYPKPNVSYVLADSVVHYNPDVPPPPPSFFVKLTTQDYSGYTLVGEPTEVELQGSGELTQCMILPYLSYDHDPGTGDVFGTCISSIVCGELCTSIGDLYNSWEGSCIKSEEDTYKIQNTCGLLQTLVISNSVSSISGSAFDGCDGIRTLYIGSGITNINQVFAMGNLRGLSDVEVDAANTVYDSRNNCHAIIETATNTLIKGSNATFIPNGITSIGEYAFPHCTALTSMTIPDSVTSIGQYAFVECYGMTTCTIGSGVTSIADNAFQNCSGLTNVTIPSGVTSIGQYAFGNCSSLSSITIPDSVTSIGDSAFSDCSAMTICNIGSGVTSVGTYAFYDCSSLSSITIPDNVTSIGNNAFSDCSAMTICNIGSGVTRINDGAFYRCSSLSAITSLATTAPTISSTTFRDIKTGGTLYVPKGSSGYNVWMRTYNFYLGKYGWTKVEQ